MAKGTATWERAKFGEVVRLARETCKDPVAAGIERVIGLEHLEPGDLRVRSWADIADGTTFTTRVRPGQVLFGKRRAYQRKVAVADFDAICSGDIYVFESANPKRLLPELLPFICQTDAFFEHAVGTSAGSLSPRTNWSSLADYEFALPPLEEQHSLLSLLNAGNSVDDALRSAVKRAFVQEQSLLHAMFYPRASEQLVRLDEVAEIKLGYKVTPAHRGERTSKPIVTVAQLQDGKLDLRELKVVTIPHGMVEAYRPRIGSLLVTEGGNLDQLGRGAIWRGEYKDCIFQNHVFQITPKPGLVRVEYLEAFMRSPRGRAFFLRNAKRTSNLASIDQRKVRSLMLPLPSPSEQALWIGRYQGAHNAHEAVRMRLRAARPMSAQLLTLALAEES